MVGELALDGSVRPVPGVLAIAEAARERGCEAIVVPADNGAEAALVEDLGGDLPREPRLRSRHLPPASGARRDRSRCRSIAAGERRFRISLTCAASATSATRSRSLPRAGTAC